MDKLTQAALELLRETAKHTNTLLATAEEVAYFGPTPNVVSTFVSSAPIKIAPPPVKVAAPPPVALEPVKAQVAPASPVKSKPTSDIRVAVQKIFPELLLRDSIPDDRLAKKMAQLWEETYLSAKVVIIAFGETALHLEFLNQVTGAIDKLLAPAKLLDGEKFEKEHGWELLLNSPLLHTIICSSWASWKETSLARHYRQNGATEEHFLAKRPLLLLEPIAHYLKDPHLKRKLWKDLNLRLSS